MSDAANAAVRIGQIWREDDGRFQRLVKVTHVWNDEATIRTCDEHGQFAPRSRFSCAKLARFGKKGGYLLHKGA